MRPLLTWLNQPLHLTLLLLSAVPSALVAVFQGRYAVNFPRGDQFHTVPTALAAHDGTLTLADLMLAEDGHIQFFTRLQTALVTWATDWNLNVEMRVNLVLAVICFGLLVALFNRTQPRAVAAALVPFALLVFSLNQDFMWIVGFSSCWFYTNAFLLLALNLVAYAPERPTAFTLALLSATAATFSFGNGLLAWVVVGLVLPVVGFRNWRYYAVWGGVGTAVIIIFLVLAGIEADTAGTATPENVVTGFTLTPESIRVALQFALTFVGSPFTTDSVQQADRIALAGVGVALANIVYLLASGGASRENLRLVGVWTALALFPAASGLLAGFSRPNWYGTGAEAALQTQYKTGAVLFWAGLVAVMIAAVGDMHRRGGVWRRLALAGNIAFGAGLLFVYVIVNYISVGEPWHWSHRIKAQMEDCYVRSLYIQEPDLNIGDNCWGTHYANDLAPRGMALFATHPATTILPGGASGVPVLVSGPDEQAAAHVAAWLLAEVPPGAVRLANADTPLDPDEGGLWHVRWAGTPPERLPDLSALTDAGFVAVPLTYTIDAGLTFDLTLYERVPDDVTASARFGEGITMPVYASVSGMPAACEPLTVKTFWSADGPTDIPYSLTLTLLAADNTPTVRADAQLSVVPSNEWQAGQTYPDVRTLSLPCDLPAGAYRLAVGVYDWRDGVRLPVALADGDPPPDDLLIVETVTVSP